MTKTDNCENVDAGTLHTGGVTWHVEFSTRSHYFTARAEGFSETKARDWDTLTDNCKVKVSQSKTPVEVRFAELRSTHTRVPVTEGITGSKGTYYNSYSIHTATATGIHAGNGNVLVLTDDGTRTQVESVYTSPSTHFLPPDKATGDRLAEVSTQISLLQAERNRILERLKFPKGSLRNQVFHEVVKARKAKGDG